MVGTQIMKMMRRVFLNFLLWKATSWLHNSSTDAGSSNYQNSWRQFSRSWRRSRDLIIEYVQLAALRWSNKFIFLK